MLTDRQRRLFDSLLDAIVAELPDTLHELIEEVPVVVEDEPSARLLAEMEIDPRATDLCGLYSGIPLTDRSVEHTAPMPDRIMIFRGPIMRTSGRRRGELAEQIRITLLHEIGHHFGFDEDQLAELGYG